MKKKILIILIIFAGIISCNPKKDNTVQKEKIIVKKAKKVPLKQKKNEEINKKIKPFLFTRGIYLTAYTINSKKFETIIAKAKKAGINTVVFDIKNMNGNVFFKKKKKIGYLTSNHKPILDIKKTVDYLHKNGIRAVARIVMFHDQFLAKTKDELRPMSKKTGFWQESRRKKAWLDSSNPKVQKYLLSIIKLVAKSGVDEIQLDYIRFPTQGNQRDVIFYFQKL